MNDIFTLREHLFDALNRLKEADSEDLDNEINRAASIVQVSESIIRSAEVENQFIQLTNQRGSGFISESPTTETFNVDKEKNWLADGGDAKSDGGLGVHKLHSTGSD